MNSPTAFDAEPAGQDAAVQSLQLQPAGLASRAAAAVIDLVVILVIVGAVYVVLAGATFLIDPRSFTWPNRIGWTIPLVGLVVATPYLALSWCASGRSVGGGLLGLRVLTNRRGRVRLPRAVLRALGCLVFPLGLLWIPFCRQRCSLQDLLARTVVVYDWRSHRGMGSRA